MTNLQTILSYIEAVASTNSDLSGHITITKPGEPIPSFKDYGLRVYVGDPEWLKTKRLKIGPILTQVYRINMDLVFNRNLTSANIFSDAKGISYWETTLTALFANRRVIGLFRDSYWYPKGSIEYPSASVIIKGILEVTIDTFYNTGDIIPDFQPTN